MQVICAWDNRGLLNVCLARPCCREIQTECHDPGFVILSFPVLFWNCVLIGCVLLFSSSNCVISACFLFRPVSCLSISTECVLCQFAPVFPQSSPRVPSLCSLLVFPLSVSPRVPSLCSLLVFPLSVSPRVPSLCSLYVPHLCSPPEPVPVSSSVSPWFVFCFLFLLHVSALFRVSSCVVLCSSKLVVCFSFCVATLYTILCVCSSLFLDNFSFLLIKLIYRFLILSCVFWHLGPNLFKKRDNRSW